MNRPLVPEDITRAPFSDGAAKSFVRAVASIAVARAASDKSTYVDPEAVVRERWPRDITAGQICKAAVNPADTTTSGWASQLVTTSVQGFLTGLALSSAAAALFARAKLVDLAGVGTVSIPFPITMPQPGFVSESGAIPVVQSNVGDLRVGPASKLAFICAFSQKLARYSAAAAEVVIEAAMRTAAAAALDASVFSAAAASAIRPAGILNGVTPIAAAAASAGDQAMVTDLGSLAGALAAAGGGANIMWIANPAQATVIKLRAPTFDVVPTPALPEGTVVAVDVGGIATGFLGAPEVSVSRDATLHMDSAATAIGTPGALPPPNTVAAPTRSLWQTDSMALRLILNCAWAAAPSMVQVINDANW